MDIDYNNSMFQLTDASLERIIFAMEDQSKTQLINLETGDLVEAALVPPEERGSPDSAYAPPPLWDSRRGFTVLEAFSATVTNPPELKAALSAALRRGRGVFKAFRAALSADEALFQRFQEFKLRAMRPFVEAWMESHREGTKLASLKDEPEDIGDLIASEIDTVLAPARGAPFSITDLISASEPSAGESLPPSIRAWFRARLLDRACADQDWLWLAFTTADGSNPLMVALYSMETVEAALPLCVVHGILSENDSVGIGIEWLLLESIAAQAQRQGAAHLVLEGPLFPASVAYEAEEHGFARSGGTLFRAL